MKIKQHENQTTSKSKSNNIKIKTKIKITKQVGHNLSAASKDSKKCQEHIEDTKKKKWAKDPCVTPSAANLGDKQNPHTSTETINATDASYDLMVAHRVTLAHLAQKRHA